MRINHIRPPEKRQRQREGFSLVEVVVSTFLVGMIIVAAMKGLGSSARANERTEQSGRAVMLADALMSEIQRQAYLDDNSPIFGRETDETASDRTQHDDVDDYDGWSSTPPTTRDGADVPEYSGWERSVEVDHVDPITLQILSDLNDSGAKRIKVSIKRNGETLAELLSIVTGIAAGNVNQSEI